MADFKYPLNTEVVGFVVQMFVEYLFANIAIMFLMIQKVRNSTAAVY